MSEKLPADVLGLIFRFAVIDHIDRKDRCIWCDRACFYVLSGPTAVSIRSVCRRWRDVFLHKVLLPGVAGSNARALYCLTPMICSYKYSDYIKERLKSTRPIFHVVRLNTLDLELYNSDTDSDFIDEEETISTDEGRLELVAYWEGQWEYSSESAE